MLEKRMDKIEVLILRRFAHRLFRLPDKEKRRIKEQVLHMSSPLKLALLAKNCIAQEVSLKPLGFYSVTKEQFSKNFHQPARLLFDHPEYQALFLTLLFEGPQIKKKNVCSFQIQKETELSPC